MSWFGGVGDPVKTAEIMRTEEKHRENLIHHAVCQNCTNSILFSFMFAHVLSSLLYSIKCLEVTVVGIWCYINKAPLNLITPPS